MDIKRDYVMYIFVNNDLQMSKGKIASQVGHVVQKIIEDIYENKTINQTINKTINQTINKTINKTINQTINQTINKKKIDIFNRYNNWKNGSKKIILRASYLELLELQQESEAVSIYDAGKTQINANSLTCIGFYPSCYNQEKFKKFKLL
jgi:peptidyl-tRNA hydrolase